jgi:hypothetical protein
MNTQQGSNTSYRRYKDKLLAGRKPRRLFVHVWHEGSAASGVCEVKLLRLNSKLDRDQVSIRAIVPRTGPCKLVAGADASSVPWKGTWSASELLWRVEKAYESPIAAPLV